MVHPRQQIRDLVEAALIGLPITGTRVFLSRVYPLQGQELPGLCVYTSEENSERLTFSSAMHQLEVKVEAYVKQTTDYDNIMDDICLQVQEAIASDAALKSTLKDIFPSSFSEDFSKESEKPVVIGTITFLADYTTNPKNPDIIT